VERAENYGAFIGWAENKPAPRGVAEERASRGSEGTKERGSRRRIRGLMEGGEKKRGSAVLQTKMVKGEEENETNLVNTCGLIAFLAA